MSRYKSPISRGSGKPREYRQSFGSVEGRDHWWSCAWQWRNGRWGSCDGGPAESDEDALRKIAQHVATVHGEGAQ